MDEHIETVAVTLNELATSINDSALILSDFKYQLPNLKEEDVPGFLSNMFGCLKVSDAELEHNAAVGLTIIQHSLRAMDYENSMMDLFLADMLEEMSTLEKKILDVHPLTEQEMKPKVQEFESVESLSAYTKAEAKALVEKGISPLPPQFLLPHASTDTFLPAFKDYIVAYRKCQGPYDHLTADHPRN